MLKSPEAFRTISEVADQLDVPAHVLRFWETRFTQIKPIKRGGGRRYYRPDDVRLLRGIRGLLYDEGLTIKGVQKLLREKGIRHVIALGAAEEAAGTFAAAAGHAALAPREPALAGGNGGSPPVERLDLFSRHAAAPGQAPPAPALNGAAPPPLADDCGAAEMPSIDREALRHLVRRLEDLRAVMTSDATRPG